MRRSTIFCVLIAVLWSMGFAVCQAELIFDWTNRGTAGFSPSEELVIDTAFEIWDGLLPTPESRTVALEIAREILPDGVAGAAFNFQSDPLGNPVGASIEIAANVAFFVDPTPFDNIEYVPSG